MWESLSLAVCFFCFTPPLHFSHYSSGPRLYNSTFIRNFMPDPRGPSEPHKSDRNPQGEELPHLDLPPGTAMQVGHSTGHCLFRMLIVFSVLGRAFHHSKSTFKTLSRISLVLALSDRNSFLRFVVWDFVQFFLFCFLFGWFCLPGVLSIWILEIFSSYHHRLLCEQQ